MNKPTPIDLPLSLIYDPDRLRQIDPAHVAILAASIEQRGLRQPIEVRQADSDGRHRLIAGSHRLAAMRSLGHTSIPAFIVTVAGDDEARLLEIEENLIRHDLTALDRAVFLAAWKATYQRLTNARGRGRPKENNSGEPPEFPLPFSEAVASRLRMDPSSVNKAIRRADLVPALRAAISGTDIADNGAALDMLRRLTPADQHEIAGQITPETSLADVRHAAARLQGKPEAAGPDMFQRFLGIWAKASEADKKRIRDHAVQNLRKAQP